MNSAYCRRRSVISPLITLLIHYCCCRRRPLRCEFQTSRSFVVSYASCLSSFAFASGRNSLSSRGKTHHRCLICMYETIEARYTLATKLNSTQSTCGNKSATKSTVADMVNFVTDTSTLLPVFATNRQQLVFESLSRSTLLPIRSTLSPVCTGPKQRGRLCRLSTKSIVLNSTLSPVCTGLK